MLEVNGTSLFFVVSFLLFAFVLNLILWEPIRKTKGDRAAHLSEQLNSAQEAETKAKAIVLQVKKETEAIRKSEFTLMEKVFAQCSLEDSEQEAQLKKEFDLLKEKTVIEIQFDKTNLIESLYPEAKKLAQTITDKVIHQGSHVLTV